MRVSQLIKPAGYADSVEQTLERRWFSEPLEYAMTKLSVEERNLLVLRVFEDKPFTEIAQILDKNLSAVKKKYARMKQKVIKLIQEKGGAELCEIRDNRTKIEF
jgi:RNA polymerase sigma-70 factor (ECF subfamily)